MVDAFLKDIVEALYAVFPRLETCQKRTNTTSQHDGRHDSVPVECVKVILPKSIAAASEEAAVRPIHPNFAS
jgi:hypothetical protein